MTEWQLTAIGTFHHTTMKTATFHRKTLKTLLKQQKMATMAQLQEALDTRAPVTIFRKLAELDYFTSLEFIQ
ncbi:MAG: hypothetical protein ACI9Y1_003653 [Lentisphaeria bacterium]|jgi:hypothetical protein